MSEWRSNAPSQAQVEASKTLSASDVTIAALRARLAEAEARVREVERAADRRADELDATITRAVFAERRAAESEARVREVEVHAGPHVCAGEANQALIDECNALAARVQELEVMWGRATFELGMLHDEVNLAAKARASVEALVAEREETIRLLSADRAGWEALCMNHEGHIATLTARLEKAEADRQTFYEMHAQATAALFAIGAALGFKTPEISDGPQKIAEVCVGRIEKEREVRRRMVESLRALVSHDRAADLRDSEESCAELEDAMELLAALAASSALDAPEPTT